jgi:hypothetical protein
MKPFTCTCELLSDLFDFSKELLRESYSSFRFLVLKPASEM